MDKFRKWKDGKLLARVKCTTEGDGTCGNFWSELLSLEFTEDFQKAKAENIETVEKYKEGGIKEYEQYKERCFLHEKIVQNKLSKDELGKLSIEEKQQYEDDLYTDSLYEFNENCYNHWMEFYKTLSLDNFYERIDASEVGLWLTYDEFMDAFTKKSDCYSPFEHDDEENNIHIIGKYYHS